MIFEERPATAAALLDRWRFALEPHDPPETTHTIPPDGLVSLVGVQAGARLVHVSILGPASRAQTTTVAQGTTVHGWHFRPGAARPLLGLDPAALRDRIVSAEALPDALRAWARAALADPDAAEAAIEARAIDPALDDPPIRAAAAALLPGVDLPGIAELAARAGLSPRQFHRRFTAAVGLAPKLFAQVRRQRAAWVAAVLGEAASLSGVSAAAGFADQSHFARAVRASFDATPREVERYLSRIRHNLAR